MGCVGGGVCMVVMVVGGVIYQALFPIPGLSHTLFPMKCLCIMYSLSSDYTLHLFCTTCTNALYKSAAKTEYTIT